MNRKLLPIFVLFTGILGALMLLSILGSPSMSVFAGEQSIDPVENSSTAGILADPATIITVTSGTDPDYSKSFTCYSGTSIRTPCTLRRAIIEASDPGTPRPVLIKFEIPAEPEEGHDAILDVWKINLYPYMDIYGIFRVYLHGDITIDGTTQPGGRSSGPKIILVGPGTGNSEGIKIGETQFQNNHVIRGLGFQNFKNHIIINSSDNLIENNWFGVSDDGTDVYLRNDEPEDGSGSSGVALSDTATNNTIRNNVFLGFDGVAAAIRGEENTFSMNYVGTTADGSVPGKETDSSLICTRFDWLGGGGISVEGDYHQILDNIFAGLRQEVFKTSTQASAIKVGTTVDGELVIQDNLIGVDSDGEEVGVCGRGVELSSSPKYIQVESNTIVNPGLSGISLNGEFFDATTLRSNTIKSNSDWVTADLNPKPEDAIQIGAGLPDAFAAFNPAIITEIDGKTVSGENGANSACPNCVIELFLDDTDVITEALKSLAVVTANSNGKWTATLSSNLENNQGIRTTSTTVKPNTILNMDLGTTTGLSILYTEGGGPGGGNQLYMPLVINKD